MICYSKMKKHNWDKEVTATEQGTTVVKPQCYISACYSNGFAFPSWKLHMESLTSVRGSSCHLGTWDAKVFLLIYSVHPRTKFQDHSICTKNNLFYYHKTNLMNQIVLLGLLKEAEIIWGQLCHQKSIQAWVTTHDSWKAGPWCTACG